ncbi:MAG: hypothetical protein GY711_16830 [bacterium]|nr:hypothetical protein [bacterium]
MARMQGRHFMAGDDDRRGRLGDEEILHLLTEPDEDRFRAAFEDGDPVGLAERVRTWLARWGFVLDEGEVELEARLHVYADRLTLGAQQSVEEWLEDRVASAARALMARDEQLEIDGKPVEEPVEHRFMEVAATLGLELRFARKACVVVNGLEDDVRQAFFNLVHRRRDLREYARSIGADLQTTGTHLRRALLAVSLMNDPDYDPLLEDRDG